MDQKKEKGEKRRRGKKCSPLLLIQIADEEVLRKPVKDFLEAVEEVERRREAGLPCFDFSYDG